VEDLSLKDEIAIIRAGISSDFWQLMAKRLTEWHKIALNELLSPSYKNKDYLSGKVKGFEDLLNWPETRMQRISAKIRQESGNKP
jgi:hypothetical protein